MQRYTEHKRLLKLDSLAKITFVDTTLAYQARNGEEERLAQHSISTPFLLYFLPSSLFTSLDTRSFLSPYLLIFRLFSYRMHAPCGHINMAHLTVGQVELRV